LAGLPIKNGNSLCVTQSGADRTHAFQFVIGPVDFLRQLLGNHALANFAVDTLIHQYGDGPGKSLQCTVRLVLIDIMDSPEVPDQSLRHTIIRSDRFFSLVKQFLRARETAEVGLLQGLIGQKLCIRIGTSSALAYQRVEKLGSFGKTAAIVQFIGLIARGTLTQLSSSDAGKCRGIAERRCRDVNPAFHRAVRDESLQPQFESRIITLESLCHYQLVALPEDIENPVNRLAGIQALERGDRAD